MNNTGPIRYGGLLAPMVLGLLLAGTVAQAEILEVDCTNEFVTPSTPSSDFAVVGDVGEGVVRHEPTSLEWRRCPEGMDWNGSGCGGGASEVTWQEALEYAEDIDGWRLPNIKELNSIVELCRTEPAINEKVFPDTGSSNFWSASPYAGDSDYAWYVHFHLGNDYYWSKSSGGVVRLVRDGQ